MRKWNLEEEQLDLHESKVNLSTPSVITSAAKVCGEATPKVIRESHLQWGQEIGSDVPSAQQITCEQIL